MRASLLTALALVLILPIAEAAAEPPRLAVPRGGEFAGFKKDGGLERFTTARAFAEYVDRPGLTSTLRGCGFQRMILQNYEGPPRTDAIAYSGRYKTAKGARRCSRLFRPKRGREIAGLPYGNLFRLGGSEHPGRNLRFALRRTAYFVGFAPTPSFDPGDSGLIAAAKTLYDRVR